MRDRILAAFFLATVVAVIESPAQTTPTGLFPAYTAPRTADGKPNLNGIWQSLTTANWDIQAHGAQPGPHPEIMGAWGAAPGGQSIVEGGEVPYRPEALAGKKENFENRLKVKVTNDPHRYDTGEPELQCYRPGVPRANYMPFPFQIFQNPSEILSFTSSRVQFAPSIWIPIARLRPIPGWDGRTATGKAIPWSSM